MAIASGAEPNTQMMPRVTFADPAAPSRRSPRRGLPVAIVGTALVVGGVIAQVIALMSSTWWRAELNDQTVTMRFTDFGPRAWRGFAYIYFSWGAWLIVGLTLGLGIASCVRWRGAHAFRMVGAVFAVFASFAPIIALLVFAYQSDVDAFHVVRSYTVGPYLAVLGTMATAFGAAAGSARR